MWEGRPGGPPFFSAEDLRYIEVADISLSNDISGVIRCLVDLILGAVPDLAVDAVVGPSILRRLAFGWEAAVESGAASEEAACSNKETLST